MVTFEVIVSVLSVLTNLLNNQKKLNLQGTPPQIYIKIIIGTHISYHIVKKQKKKQANTNLVGEQMKKQTVPQGGGVKKLTTTNHHHLAKQRSINNSTSANQPPNRNVEDATMMTNTNLAQQNQQFQPQIVTTFNVDKALQVRARLSLAAASENHNQLSKSTSNNHNQRVLKSQQISHRVSHNASKEQLDQFQENKVGLHEDSENHLGGIPIVVGGASGGGGISKTQQNSRRQSQVRKAGLANSYQNRVAATANASFRGSVATTVQAREEEQENNLHGAEIIQMSSFRRGESNYNQVKQPAIQRQQNEQRNSGLTALQAKTVSQKSKMTQGLLKKLKQSIADKGGEVVPAAGSSCETSTALLGPNQSMLTSAGGTLSRTQQNTINNQQQKGSQQHTSHLTSLNQRIEYNIASVRSSIDREASQHAMKAFKNGKISSKNANVDELRHFQTLARDSVQNGAQPLKIKQSSTLDQRVFGAKNLSLQYKTSQKQTQQQQIQSQFDNEDFGSKASVDQRIHRTRPASKDNSKHQQSLAVTTVQKRKSVNQTMKDANMVKNGGLMGSKNIPQNFNQIQRLQQGSSSSTQQQSSLNQDQLKKGGNKVKFGTVDNKLLKGANKKELKELASKLGLIPRQSITRMQQITNPKLIVPNAVLAAQMVDRSKTAGNSLATSQIQSRQASLGARSFGTITNQMSDPVNQKTFQEQRKGVDEQNKGISPDKQHKVVGSFRRPDIVKPLKNLKGGGQLKGLDEQHSTAGTHRVPVVKKGANQHSNQLKKVVGQQKTRAPASFRSVTGVKAPPSQHAPHPPARQNFVSQQNSKLRLSGVNSPERSLQASKQVKDALKKFSKPDSTINRQKARILTKFETFDNKMRKDAKQGGAGYNVVASTTSSQPYTSKKIPQSIHLQESNASKKPLEIRHRRSMSLKANENSANQQTNASSAFEGVRSSHPNPTQIKQSLMEIPKEGLKDFRMQIRVQSVDKEAQNQKALVENKQQINSNLKGKAMTSVVSPTAARKAQGAFNQKKNTKKAKKDQITPNMSQVAGLVGRPNNKNSSNSRQSKLKKNSMAQSTDSNSREMQKLLKSFFTHFDTKKGSYQNNQISQKSLGNQPGNSAAWPLNQQFASSSEERHKVGCLTQSSRAKNHAEGPSTQNGQITQQSFGPTADTGSVSRKGMHLNSSSVRQKQQVSDSMKNIQIGGGGPQIRVDSKRIQNAGSNTAANQVSGSGSGLTLQNGVGGVRVIKQEGLPKNRIVVSPKSQNNQILSRAQIALQANLQSAGESFEEQQTMKRGDQILPNHKRNRSSQGSSKLIEREPTSGQSHVVQAFDEYIKEKRGSQKNQHQNDKNSKLLSASMSPNEEPIVQGKVGKFVSDFQPSNLKDFNGLKKQNPSSQMTNTNQIKPKKAVNCDDIRDFGVNFYPKNETSNRNSPLSSLSPLQNNDNAALAIQDNWDGSRNEKQSQNFFDRQIELKMQEKDSEENNKVHQVSRASLNDEDLKGIQSSEQANNQSVEVFGVQNSEKPQVAELESDDYYDEEEEMPSEPFDPLLEDKQYLVTMIVSQIQQQGEPVVTTHEFYRLGNKLGQGAFGVVCVAQHKLTGHFVAVKCLRKKDLDKQVDCKRKVAQEMQNLQHLTSHRNLVKLYDSFETDGHLCFVMELCAGGDLLSYVRMRKRLTEQVAKYFFRQIALAIAYCHKNLVVHRDIKLENLLLDEEGVLKLCDLGVSSHLESSESLLNDQCGTPAYMAPEVYLNSKPYSGQAADVWSLGVCLYAMLFGMVPFKGKSMDELRNAVISQELEFPDTDPKYPVSPQAKLVVQKLLAKESDKRLTLKQVLRSGWLKGAPQGGIKIFSDSELKKIKTLSQPANGGDEPQRLLTEVALTLPTQQSAIKKQSNSKLENGDQITKNKDCSEFMPRQNSANISQKSCILAPFNSTLKSNEFTLEQNVPILGLQAIKFSDKVREKNRQYEFNFNGEVDNGIMITQAEAEEQKIEEQSKSNKFTNNLKLNKELDPSAGQIDPSAPMVSQQSARLPQKQQNVEGSKFVSCPQISQATEVEISDAKSHILNEPDCEPSIPQEQVHIINFSGLEQQKDSSSQKVSNKKQQPISSPDHLNNQTGDREISQNNSQELLKLEDSEEHSGNTGDENESISGGGKGVIGEDLTEEEDIDRLIVCKIENEFGYPEQYLLSCLQGKIKNDATTCYYLFVKEDKHEVVHLLSESPAQNRSSSKFS